MDSQAYGPSVDTTDLSHLRAWQDIVTTRPNETALISYHQKPQDFRWLRSQHTKQEYVQWTYAELNRGARKLATTLNRLTPVNRRPIAVFLNNQAEWTLFFWAAAYLHSPLAPINPKCATRAEEVAHMLRVVQPAVVVALDEVVADQLQQSLGQKATSDIAVKIILSQTSSLQHWHTLHSIMLSDDTPPDTPTYADPSETAVILFTSGTTSLPKPCGMSSAQTANAAFAYSEPRNLKPEHRYVSHLPNFHSYGIGWILAFFLIGGTVILPADNFEAHASLQCVERFKGTHMGLVPTTALTISTHPAFSKTDLSSLVGIDISGAGIVPSVVDDCEATFKVPAGTSYGMTESPTTLIWPTTEGKALRNGHVLSGRPSRGAVVKICEPGSRTIVPRGVAGELHSGGSQVISSYLGTGISAESFYVDDTGARWIVTGDQAVMEEDGAVRISGRYKDIIIRGGENISPAAIEACLQSTAAVHMAQVVGVPDETAGEVPFAVIQTLGDALVSIDALKSKTSAALGPAFAPKMILNLKDDLELEGFPLTANGKVRKVELAAVVREWLGKRQTSSVVGESTIDSLVSIWQDISGANALLPETTLQSFADSLMMMQLSSVVKRRLGKDITVEDFKDCTTIQNQADLIDSRSEAVKTILQQQREGPPTLADVPYVHGDYESFFSMRNQVINTLREHRLIWEDVQDIAPLPDWDAVFAHKSRPQSWNLRWSFHAKAASPRLQSALRTMLEYHPALRSVAMDIGEELPVLVSLRANVRWFNAAITSGHQVQTKEDLNNLVLDDLTLDSAVKGGPMFRMHVADISDGTSGVVIVASHAVCDMSMTKLWLDDLVTILSGEGALVPHVSFFDYANAYHQHRSSVEANDSIEYWTTKLAGIGSVPATHLFPNQRAPEFFKGNDFGWQRWSGQAARKQERQTSQASKLVAQKGIRKIVKVESLAKLKSEYDVPVFMLVKAAIALMNIKRTGAEEAIFGTLNAARTWPFKSGYTADERELYTGNPLDISGCTTEYVLDRVAVDQTTSVVDFMQYVTKDEEQNSPHVKAPVLRIIDRLRDELSAYDTRSWSQRDADAEAVLSLIRRQSFNWLPSAPTAQDNENGLQTVQMLTRMDNGLTITGFLAGDKHSVVVAFTWDAEHLRLEEAELVLADLTMLIRWMSDANNWTKSVADAIMECRS